MCEKLPEVLTASSQDDPVSRKPLLLHHKGDVTVFLSRNQRCKLLREKVHVVDLGRRAQRAQWVTVTHGCYLRLGGGKERHCFYLYILKKACQAVLTGRKGKRSKARI